MDSICYIDEEKCTGCGACVDTCPTGAVSLNDGVAHVDSALCRGCAACVDVCPVGAIALVMPTQLPALARPVRPVRREDRPLVTPARPLLTTWRPPSLLSRFAGTVGPAVLSLAAGLGRAWLEGHSGRVADRRSSALEAGRGMGGQVRGRQVRWRGGGRRGRC